MDKKLFLTATAVCLIAMPVMADCVCGTANCEKCESTEDYLEDVGKHIKKQAHKIKKKAHKYKAFHASCKASQPTYWFEEADLLDKNGNVILTYAEMVEDDIVNLSDTQKKQAQKDAQDLKTAGKKIKDKAVAAKTECLNVITVDEEVDEYPTHANKMDKKDKKHSLQENGKPQLFLIEGMEENGNLLIEVGDFIQKNMTK